MTVFKIGARPWLMLAAVLIAVGVFAVRGSAGSIILACGFLALFGAGIRMISRDDPALSGKRRIPAGHSGA